MRADVYKTLPGFLEKQVRNGGARPLQASEGLCVPAIALLAEFGVQFMLTGSFVLAFSPRAA
jgi:hypothetical protein